MTFGHCEVPRKWGGGGGASKKKQNYQIYLVDFECVVKDIEAWLQLFISFLALQPVLAQSSWGRLPHFSMEDPCCDYKQKILEK
jgi:hypothetical protein